MSGALLGMGGRVVNAVLLLLAVVIMNFCLIHLAPGDPAQVIAGEMGGASPEVLATIRAQYGLDQPFGTQLANYVSRAATGDLGYSFYFNQPVSSLILERLPATVLLMAAALTFAAIVGTLLGVLAAYRPRGLGSLLVTIVSLAGHAAPVFWSGLLLLLLFASVLPLFPIAGMTDVTRPLSGIDYVLDVAHHLVLPAFTLGLVYLAQYSRQSRTSMIDVLGADYIRTARAKGLPERRVVLKHALRNALIPVVTLIGLQFAQLLAGAVLVETVFGWPGMGRLVLESILRRDHPTLLGVLVVSALLVMVANLLTDLAYRLVDPRIRGH
ncbi:ABC transporter permease [Pseudoroseomonas sp. WGS1072]|uniref:ABC transporter permease n=1 Tax=Roseomonas sp. WGS1072 TaxID=3366816 RepID=UPI003BEFD673